jgi:hypothetical protein
MTSQIVGFQFPNSKSNFDNLSLIRLYIFYRIEDKFKFCLLKFANYTWKSDNILIFLQEVNLFSVYPILLGNTPMIMSNTEIHLRSDFIWS